MAKAIQVVILFLVSELLNQVIIVSQKRGTLDVTIASLVIEAVSGLTVTDAKVELALDQRCHLNLMMYHDVLCQSEWCNQAIIISQ